MNAAPHTSLVCSGIPRSRILRWVILRSRILRRTASCTPAVVAALLVATPTSARPSADATSRAASPADPLPLQTSIAVERDAAFNAGARHSAVVAPSGSLELGVLSAARLGLNGTLELSLHPVWFFVLPRVELKARWLHGNGLTLSTRHEVSTPTLFFGVIAREGTGGLLDPNTPSPLAVVTEHGLLLTERAGAEHWLTVEPWVQLRIGESGPLLDFPFLYQRFAVVESTWAAGMRLGAEGRLFPALGYGAALTFSHLPVDVVGGAYAIEGALEARFRVSPTVAVPLGIRAARAHFPIGVRTHWFPYIDVRVSFR